VLDAPRHFELVEADVPEIAPDEALVRVAACGVCASELDMYEGRTEREYPIYPGHEVSGTVEAVGDEVTTLRAGDPVACWVTERGFSEYVAVKAEYCLPAGGLPLDLALAEPLACAVNAVELADPKLADDVVLIGCGFMSNLVQKLLVLRGVRSVTAVDTRAPALERARRLGADHTVDLTHERAQEVVHTATGGRGADVTFEVTGFQEPLVLAGELTRMSGKVVIVGYHQGGMRSIPLGDWNWNAFQIVNAHFREVSTIMRGMSVGMRLLTSGRMTLDDLVTHRFTLQQMDEAFDTAVTKPEGFVKSTVRMAG
jgi:threonine dehydrogenase-like Zn-dependent dehydrogenase